MCKQNNDWRKRLVLRPDPDEPWRPQGFCCWTSAIWFKLGVDIGSAATPETLEEIARQQKKPKN